MVTLHSVGRMAQKLLKTSLSYSWKSYQFRGFTSSDSLLLSRFTVFRMVEASAKREWLVMNRKGPWEGYRRQAKPVVSFPPSFARIFSSRETSGYEAASSEQCYWPNEKPGASLFTSILRGRMPTYGEIQL